MCYLTRFHRGQGKGFVLRSGRPQQNISMLHIGNTRNRITEIRYIKYVRACVPTNVRTHCTKNHCTLFFAPHLFFSCLFYVFHFFSIHIFFSSVFQCFNYYFFTYLHFSFYLFLLLYVEVLLHHHSLSYIFQSLFKHFLDSIFCTQISYCLGLLYHHFLSSC